MSNAIACWSAVTWDGLKRKGSPTSYCCCAIATNNPDILGDFPQNIPKRRAISSSCSLLPSGIDSVIVSFFLDICKNVITLLTYLVI
uniref:hypothetical protein n=1 Tax=Calothrix sp. PCC 6303 TaxID=1170562 RepID=UPI001EF07189|nr:hypothetical protein [Calothrix sp. PCC 6303]